MTDNLQYRLYNHSIAPPADAWPNIALELEKESEQKISLRLQQTTMQPPAGAWDKIADSLPFASTTQVIPFRKKSWTRIAVAAIAAGIVVLAGLSYILWNDGANSTAGNPKHAPKPAVTNSQTQKENIRIQMPRPASNLSLAGIGGPISIPVRRRAQDTRIRYAHVDAMPTGIDEQQVQVNELVSVQPNNYIEPQQYLTITAPNGEPAKISSKFTNGLSYLFNHEPVFSMDGVFRSISWKQRFNNWSNKLINRTGFIPAASNFLDIVELEELLKEQ